MLLNLVFLLWLQIVIAQNSLQLFEASGFPSLSTACANALAANISCSTEFADGSQLYTYIGLSLPQIDALCTPQCTKSIDSYRKAVLSACAHDIFIDAPTDNATLIVPGTATNYTVYDQENTEVQPIAFADYYILNYKLNCLTDTDGLFCYSKANGSQLPACSKCTFDSLILELEDPRTYDEDLASSASISASMCGTTFSFATPTQGITTSSTSASPTPTCTGFLVTLKNGDTCDSVARANNISTDALLQRNGLIAGCVDFPNNGTTPTNGTLCVEGSCNTYTVKANDTCPEIANAHNATIIQILSWNPAIDPKCLNLGTKVGHVICVSSPLGFVDLPAVNDSRPLVATAPAPVPTNIAPNTTTDCGYYYYVSPGDYCQYVTNKNGITLSDFYFLNPMLDANCSNLWANTSYCVEAVGDISTYAGYGGAIPTTTYAVVTVSIPAWTNLPTTTRPTFTAPKPTATTYSLANNTRTDCFQYYQNSYGSISCLDIVDNFAIDFNDFLLWNPSLKLAMGNSTSCALLNQTSYCVELADQSLFNITTTTKYADVPPDAASNSTTNCFGWWEVQTGDTCDRILQAVDIDFTAFYTWNPSIGNNCQYLQLNTSYCVYGIGFEDACYSCTASITASLPMSTPTSGPPAPTQSGIVAGCTEWYVAVPNDNCIMISAKFNITFAQFLAWNPAVMSDCSGLWKNEAYCVKAASTTPITTGATATTTGVAIPSPTQSGIISTCNKYVQQAGNVYCYDMAAAAGITLAQFYAWNPALNGDCSGLWPGYYYCIGVSS